MLFNNFIALAFAAAPALALPSENLALAREVSAQALDITVKFHSTTVCDDSGGPDRDYVSGTCLPLPESSHGVRIISRREGCRRKLNYIAF
jgi:hypothetical protein